MSMNLRDITILNIYKPDYCCIISGINNSKAIKVMQKIDLMKKGENYKNKHNYYHIQKWVKKL